VLVLGTHPEKYTHLGTVVHRPMVKCVGLEDCSRLDRAIEQLDTFEWLIFTSANGAKYFFDRLKRKGLDTRALALMKVAAIGKTTATRLSVFGVLADLVPDTESSAGLLEEFRKLDMKDKKVLLPQAKVASAELPDGLAELGAAVELIPVYETVEIEPDDVDLEHIDQILFTSGSTAQAFVKKFGKLPAHVKAYCLGEPTQASAKAHGIDAEILPQKDR